MDNHEMLIGQRQDMSLVQNQQLGLRHGQGLVVGQNRNMGLAPHNHNHEIKLGQNHNQDMHLGHSHGHGHDRELLLNHDDSNRHDNGYDENDDEGDDLDRGIDHDQDRTKNHDSHLVLSDQTTLGLSDNNTLAVVNNHELDENLDLVVHPHPEMGMVPLTAQHPDLVVTTPVIQSRTLAPSPNYELMVGQEFPDVTSCRRALRHTAIALHFEIQTVKSDKTRFTAKCASEGCPWRIHAAKLPGVPTFTIRTIHGEHTCGGIAHLGHQQASVQWVANSVEQRLKENPQCKPKEILEEIHRVHGITLSYKQAWRGKERIMAALRGSFEEDYRLLPQYCDQVRRTNPDSIASVYVNANDNCFQRLFISFQASIYGFLNACRPLLGLDRTVLKSKYLGTLLFATGFDGDGALFPLAFGVVDEENNDNWMWFLSELHNLLEINTENMPRLTILSDRQKSIVDGVEANFPTAFHGFCMRHLSESFRKEFNNIMLVNLLWDAANALTVMDFESKILEIEEISQEAAYWIRRVPARLWATAYFEGTRFGHLTANIVESLNVWILEASGLPIIQMMECIRRQLMTWFNERRESSMQWTSILVPTAERRVSEAIDRARTYQVLRANEAEFEVISHEGTNIVDIRNRCCENARLKDELDRVCALAGKFLGRPVSSMAPPMPNSSLELGVGGNHFGGGGGGGGLSSTTSAMPLGTPDFGVGISSASSVLPSSRASNNVMGIDHSLERSMYLELALAAMDELVKLAQTDEPLWVRSLEGGREIMNENEYSRAITPCIGIKPNEYVSEASRATGMVIINSMALVETLMDSNKWAEMFPCMIARTSTTDVISNGMGGTRNGALQLMHAELQVLSPLVPVREVNFLRFCKQHAEGVWAVVDVSIDTIRENAPTFISCRRLPSGCVVQDMPNGYSKVTWVEHAEYDESAVHELYRPLVRAGMGFGAQRWVAALQRQCECLAILMSSAVPTRDHTAITASGRKSMLKLAQRMTDNFCAGVCASTVYKWNKLCANNVDQDVRVMTRQSVDDPGEPPGIVLSAATSVWLPVSPQRLFDFLRDERLRSEWDILSNGGPMQEMAHIAKGQDHGNCVSLLRASAMNANQSSMLILQETCIDAAGSLVVYAPVDIPAMHVVMNGGDSAYVALLPSGFAIVPDGPGTRGGSETDNGGVGGGSGGGPSGSLLTVAFQILVNSLPTAKLTVESVETVNNLISCTVQKIKAALPSDN